MNRAAGSSAAVTSLAACASDGRRMRPTRVVGAAAVAAQRACMATSLLVTLDGLGVFAALLGAALRSVTAT